MERFGLSSYWEKRQKNRAIVGKIVTTSIFEEKSNKKIKGTFLIIFTNDLHHVGLQLMKYDIDNIVDFPVFNGEMVVGEKNFHTQKFLHFTSNVYTKTMRLLNLEALGGMVDIDLETIHIFDANITFDSMKEIDGNAFESIMIPFFNNPVDDISEEQLVREIYEQYNR
jgi:hypothetical protein